MTNVLKSHDNAHGELSPQALIGNPIGVQSFSPGLAAQRPTLGNIPSDAAADSEAARQRETNLRQKSNGKLMQVKARYCNLLQAIFREKILFSRAEEAIRVLPVPIHLNFSIQSLSKGFKEIQSVSKRFKAFSKQYFFIFMS